MSSLGSARCCGWNAAPVDAEGIPQLTIVHRSGAWAWGRYVFLRLLCLPMDLVGFLIVLTVGLAWGKKGNKVGWDNRVFWAQIDDDSWPAKTWYRRWGATTFAHNIMFGRSQIDRPDLWAHELTHVEQYEAEAVQATGLVFAGWGLWQLGLSLDVLFPSFLLFLCAFNGLSVFAAGMLTAWLRGEDPYTGSHLEESARARVETDLKA